MIKISIALLLVFLTSLAGAQNVDTGLEQGNSFSSDLLGTQKGNLIPNSSILQYLPGYSDTAKDEWSNKGDSWRDNPEDIESESKAQFSSTPEGQYLKQSINTRPVFNIDYSDPIIERYKNIGDAVEENYSACYTREECLSESTQEWEETETCWYDLIYSKYTCTEETQVTSSVRRQRWLEITIDGNDDHLAFTLYVDTDKDGTIDKSIDMPSGVCFYRMKGDIFGNNKNQCWRLTESGWGPVSCPGGMTGFTDNPAEWRDDGIEQNLKNVVQNIWGLPTNSSQPVGTIDNVWYTAKRCGHGDADGDGRHLKYEVVISEQKEETKSTCGLSEVNPDTNTECKLESSTCLESGERVIPKPMGGQFILSGSSDPGTSIFVNDDIQVYVNGASAYQDEPTTAHSISPIRLVLVHGDTIRIVAKETNGFIKQLSPIWLHNTTTGDKAEIHPGVPSGSGCSCTFADISYKIDWQTSEAITRDCWKSEDTYVCAEEYVEDEKCLDLKADGCYQVDSRCAILNDDGKCASYEQTYKCPKTGETQCTEKKSELVCDGEVRCVFGIDCFDPTIQPNQNFSLAAAHMGWLSDIQDCLNQSYQDPAVPPTNEPASPIDCADIDPLNIFKAKNLHCDKNLANVIQNCCADSGLFKDSCPDKARELLQRRKAGACHYVGSYCSDEVLGVCVQRRSSYCCFNSELARIIHEQGRPQLIDKGMWPTTKNEGWGDEEDPNCGGFSIEQLQAIDFSKIDFSEYFDNIVVELMPPDTATSGTSTDETNMQSQDCPYNPELYPELCSQ